MTRDDLLQLLRTARIDLSSEKAAQADVAQLLASHIPGMWEREFRLNARDRPDFIVHVESGLIVIEMKGFRQKAATVMGQLARYAEDARVCEIVLLSNTAVQLPLAIGGKPASVISLGRAWL